jgi:peptidoglycan-associated lipoprotein
MRRKLPTLVSLALLATGTLWLPVGCKKKAPTTVAEKRPAETAPAPPSATPVPAPVTSAPIDDTQRILSSSIQELNSKGYLQDAYFDYDKYELRDDARSALATDAEWLKKYGTIQILIEGHCDDRGTNEYNLALGERRARAAMTNLVERGIDMSRITIISYGKERPVCTERTPPCWARNRSDRFLTRAR